MGAAGTKTAFGDSNNTSRGCCSV